MTDQPIEAAEPAGPDGASLPVRRADGFLQRYFDLQPILVPICAILLAFAVGGFIIFLTEVGDGLGEAIKAPFEAYWALLRGMFAPDRIAASLGRSTPFIGAALAVVFAFRAGLFNIGVEGQLLIGATAAAWVGTWGIVNDLPGVVAIVVILLAGMIGGGLYGAVPGALKARTGAHEVIVTIMLNNIAILYVRWMVGSQDPVILRDMGASVPRTRILPDHALLPDLVQGAQPLHTGFLIMVGLCFVVWFILQRTTTGFEVRMVGANSSAAKYAGVPVGRVLIVLVMALAGSFAGLAGAGEIVGTHGFLSPGVFVAVGFDSIAIVLLARANPFAVIPAAILWGSLLVGAPLMQQETGLSIDIVRIVQALVLLFVAADVIVRTVFHIRRPPAVGADPMAEASRGPVEHDMTTAITARRITPRVGRLQTIGLLYGFFGVLLAVYVTPNLEPDDKAFLFEPPPDAVQFSFDPRTVVFAMGVFFALTAVVSLLGPRYERWAKAGVLVSTILFAPLVVILALALSEAGETNVVQLLVASLDLATPFALGAMCGLWCERSGVVNIGIEGTMLAAAGVGFTVYAVAGDAQGTGWLWVGIAVAVLTGGLIGAVHVLVGVSFRVNQIISGVVINLLALGMTSFLRSQVIVPRGISTGATTSEISVPGLSSLPLVGEELFKNKPIFYAMFAIVAATAFVLGRTRWGLRVRSVGENPHAAETLGIDVIKIRYQAVILGSLIAGLGGAWFSMENQGGFQDSMTNGAGFIALAALIFGRWKPWGAFAGAMLFGFTRALGTRLQILDVEVGDFSIPSEFWQSLPYIVTIVVVAGAIGRAIPPAADGEPYERSR